MWSPAASATSTARSPSPRVGARQREGAAFWLSGVGSSGGLVGGSISTVTTHDARALWRLLDPHPRSFASQQIRQLRGAARLARTLASMTVPVSGVRQQSVWASVVSDDAQALRGWLLALGFTEDLLIPGDDPDTIHHCQLDWPEGGRVLLSSTGERPTPCRPGTSSLHVVTATPDAVMARARALEVRVVHELVDQTDYPSRDFTVADPDGNHWTFATFAG